MKVYFFYKLNNLFYYKKIFVKIKNKSIYQRYDFIYSKLLTIFFYENRKGNAVTRKVWDSQKKNNAIPTKATKSHEGRARSYKPQKEPELKMLLM